MLDLSTLQCGKLEEYHYIVYKNVEKEYGLGNR